MGHRSDYLENRSVAFELFGNKAQLVVNEVLIYLENSLSEHLWTDCVHLWVESKVDEANQEAQVEFAGHFIDLLIIKQL